MSQLFPAGGQSTGASASASERWTLREVSFSAALREVASAPQVPPQVSFLCPLPSASFSRFCSPMDILSLSLSVSLSGSIFTLLLVLFLASLYLCACVHWLRV